MPHVNSTTPRSRVYSEALARTLRIVERLKGGAAVELTQLADDFGVCTRTIRRDLATIEAVGLPIYEEQTGAGNGKRWRLLKRGQL